MDILIKKRSHIRSRVTKLCNQYNESTVSALDAGERLALLTKIRGLHTEISNANESIHLHVDFEDDTLDKCLTEEEVYDDKIGLLLVQVEGLPALAAASIPAHLSVPNSITGTGGTKVKVPNIPLPKFSNSEGENLKEFLLSFDAILGKRGLNEHQLYACLGDQLREVHLR